MLKSTEVIDFEAIDANSWVHRASGVKVFRAIDSAHVTRFTVSRPAAADSAAQTYGIYVTDRLTLTDAIESATAYITTSAV
jgi:hypothetical protein